MAIKKYLYAARTTGDAGRIINKLAEKGIKASVEVGEIGIKPRFPQVLIIKMDLEAEKQLRAATIIKELFQGRIFKEYKGKKTKE